MQCKPAWLFLAYAVPMAPRGPLGLQYTWWNYVPWLRRVQCHFLHDVCPSSRQNSSSLLCVPVAPYTCSRCIQHIALVADCLSLPADCRSPKGIPLIHLGKPQDRVPYLAFTPQIFTECHQTPKTIVGTVDISTYKPVKVPLLISLHSSETHRHKPNKQ